MRLSHTPPAGAGKVQRITKTELLLAHIEGLGLDKVTFNPVGIRVAALSQATGVPTTSIPTLLAPHVDSGRIAVCKISIPGTPPQNEYRKGCGVPPPEFKPLNTKRAGIAIGQPAHRGGTATAPALSTPRRDIGAIETPTFIKQPQPAVGSAAPTPAAGCPEPPRAAPAVAAAPATPAPDARAVLKIEPAAQKAPAGDDFRINLDDTGVLTIATDEGVIELQPKHTQRLGHFLVGSQGIWNPF